MLVALRVATHLLHEELDRRLPLSRPDAGLAAYADHLRHLRPWLARYAAWEAAVESTSGPDGVPSAPSPVAVLPPSGRRKGELIARIDADLALVAPHEHPAPQAATIPSQPDMALPAYRWGVDYVIEGSQLGGAVLFRRLAARLAPHPLVYLQGDGAATGPHWRAFMADLQSAVVAPADVAVACRGAVDAFTALMRSFGLPTDDGVLGLGQAT